MGNLLRALFQDRTGATALEYGLIVALISIMVVAWATTVGTSVSTFFDEVAKGF